jgi:hypothetical protein
VSYIYEADIYCNKCGDSICERLRGNNQAPDDPEDESTFDSDDYPKGPFGEGEADYPQHCGECGVFLENALTSDGEDYVREAAKRSPNNEAVQEWVRYYSYLNLEDEEDE